jgi:glycosyltransferase involved in cell wall biosynthesis
VTTGVLSTSFPRFPGDFAGCFVEDAVRASAAAGETLEVIAAGDRETRSHRGGASMASDASDGRADLLPAVRVTRVAMPMVVADRQLFFGAGAPETLERGGPLAWAQALFFWAALCERARARARHWDRIVAHWLVPCGLAARAVAPHLPLTAYAHSGDVALLERIPGGATLGRRLAREIDDLIFVSSDLKRRFTRLTGIAAGRLAPPLARPLGSTSGGASAVPGWATETPRWLAFQRTLADSASPIVLSVGRLVPIKGFDVLLRSVALAAAADSTSRRHRIKVVILGEGPERRRLEAMATRLEIDLCLPGVVPRDDVPRWMSFADLYVQPSRPLSSGRTEGLPVATLEALSAGLRVIASATGGLAELHGVSLVPSGDAGALADSLARAIGASSPWAVKRNDIVPCA